MRFKFFMDFMTGKQAENQVLYFPDNADGSVAENPWTVPLGTGHRFEAIYDEWLAAGNVTEPADPLPTP